MSQTRVAILGASGMLGSMVTDFFSHDENISVTATMRSAELIQKACRRINNIEWKSFEIKDEKDTIQQLRDLGDYDWVINAIGKIKPYIHDDKPDEIEQAITVNAAFPHWLARTFNKARVLQIATDCVYSGTKGQYIESDTHDALDVYGKTKSLGEVVLPNVSHLRCSIIGPETEKGVSLLEWFRHQPENAKLRGFINHLWNGVTTLHYAKICHGIIKNNISVSGLQHVVPHGDITKYSLLCCFAKCYQRTGLEISKTDAPKVIDRRLATNNNELNNQLWKSAGYETHPPTVEKMVEEMAVYQYRLGNLVE